MNPQGSSIINTEQIDSLKARVESCKTCEQLQEVTTSVMETIDAEKDAVVAQIAKLTPIAALVDVPTDPQEVIDWLLAGKTFANATPSPSSEGDKESDKDA